jgi:hypothetical protein
MITTVFCDVEGRKKGRDHILSCDPPFYLSFTIVPERRGLGNVLMRQPLTFLETGFQPKMVFIYISGGVLGAVLRRFTGRLVRFLLAHSRAGGQAGKGSPLGCLAFCLESQTELFYVD